MKKIGPLKKGDVIGIAAPSSPFDRHKFMKGIKVLNHLGFETFYCHDIFDQNRYLAGTDERRARELEDLFTDKNVSAIMFARGGYGSQRVIPMLNLEVIRRHPKPIIGFSDLTPLIYYLNREAAIPTFYGPVITQLATAKNEMITDALFSALTSGGALGEMPMGKSVTIKDGAASGKLVGGCLSLINSSIKTPYELKADGCILFIEDVNENVYVMDRMLTQLKNSGAMSGVRGVLFGSIIPPPDEPHDVRAMIIDVMGDFKGPVVMDYPAGHIDEFVTLPMGIEATLDATHAEHPKLIYTERTFS